MSADRMNLITMQEAMDFLGVSRSTIDRWRKHKQLPFIKIGKEVFFDKEILIKWLYNHTQINTPASLPQNPQSHSIPITVGYQSGTAHMWSAVLIKELNLFEEELKKMFPHHSFSIRWRNASKGIELVEDMIKGTVQIASLGDYPIMLSFEFCRLLPTFQSVLLAFDGKTTNGKGISLVAQKETFIEDVSDLVNVSVSTVSFSSAEHRLKRLLCSIGDSHPQIINQDMEMSMKGIVQQRIGASVMWEPYPSLINYYQAGNVFFETGMGDDYLTGIVSEQNWCKQNEEIVVAYLKAHLCAHKILREDPSSAAKVLSRSTGVPIEVVSQIISRVRWDAAIYVRDLETIGNFHTTEYNDRFQNFNGIIANDDYLQMAISELKLPMLPSIYMRDEWSEEDLY